MRGFTQCPDVDTTRHAKAGLQRRAFATCLPLQIINFVSRLKFDALVSTYAQSRLGRARMRV